MAQKKYAILVKDYPKFMKNMNPQSTESLKHKQDKHREKHTYVPGVGENT